MPSLLAQTREANNLQRGGGIRFSLGGSAPVPSQARGFVAPPAVNGAPPGRPPTLGGGEASGGAIPAPSFITATTNPQQLIESIAQPPKTASAAAPKPNQLSYNPFSDTFQRIP